MVVCVVAHSRKIEHVSCGGVVGNDDGTVRLDIVGGDGRTLCVDGVHVRGVKVVKILAEQIVKSVLREIDHVFVGE